MFIVFVFLNIHIYDRIQKLKVSYRNNKVYREASQSNADDHHINSQF